MIRQTIALFRYQLVGIITLRLALLVAAVTLVAFLMDRFVVELAIINSETIAFSIMAEFMRYSLVLVMIVTLSYQVSQDYDTSQFDRMLAMPLRRWQYLLAQSLVMLSLAGLIMLPGALLASVLGTPQQFAYWSMALLLELILVGQFTLLAILSLEKLPLAVMLTLALYLLARATPVIAIILAQSSPFYGQENSFQIASTLFDGLQYLLPDASAFAQNDILSQGGAIGHLLGRQVISVLSYGAFLQVIILFDFYRKELN